MWMRNLSRRQTCSSGCRDRRMHGAWHAHRVSNGGATKGHKRWWTRDECRKNCGSLWMAGPVL